MRTRANYFRNRERARVIGNTRRGKISKRRKRTMLDGRDRRRSRGILLAARIDRVHHATRLRGRIHLKSLRTICLRECPVESPVCNHERQRHDRVDTTRSYRFPLAHSFKTIPKIMIDRRRLYQRSDIGDGMRSRRYGGVESVSEREERGTALLFARGHSCKVRNTR